MRTILKYIIPIFMFVAIWSNDKDVVSSQMQLPTDKTAEYSERALSICLAYAEPAVSFSTSSLNSTRVHNNTRRGDSGQRNIATFIRAGRLIDTSTLIHQNKILKLKHSALSEPYHRLISLGKLII